MAPQVFKRRGYAPSDSPAGARRAPNESGRASITRLTNARALRALRRCIHVRDEHERPGVGHRRPDRRLCVAALAHVRDDEICDDDQHGHADTDEEDDGADLHGLGARGCRDGYEQDHDQDERDHPVRSHGPTVAPSQFATVTLIELEPVAPAESRTPTVGVRAPLSAAVVDQGIDTGPELVVVVVPSVRPPSVSVYVFDPAAAPSIQIVNHMTPRMVSPLRGWVMKTLIGPPGGGGGGAAFCAVTPRAAVAVRPAPSCTVRASVCGPSPTDVVFQLNDALVAEPELAKTRVPSTVSVKAIGVPLAPLADMPTVTVPVTVAPSAGAVNEAASGGGAVPPPAFCTLNARVVLPELPDASRTVATSVCVPLATRVESHASVT